MSLHSLYHILETPGDVHQLEKNQSWNQSSFQNELHDLLYLSHLLLYKDNMLYLKRNKFITKLILPLFVSIPFIKDTGTVASCCSSE